MKDEGDSNKDKLSGDIRKATEKESTDYLN